MTRDAGIGWERLSALLTISLSAGHLTAANAVQCWLSAGLQSSSKRQVTCVPVTPQNTYVSNQPAVPLCCQRENSPLTAKWREPQGLCCSGSAATDEIWSLVIPHEFWQMFDTRGSPFVKNDRSLWSVWAWSSTAEDQLYTWDKGLTRGRTLAVLGVETAVPDLYGKVNTNHRPASAVWHLID